MRPLSDFPRVPLAILPTPLYQLPNVSRVLGKNVWVKRDDMTGVALGGPESGHPWACALVAVFSVALGR